MVATQEGRALYPGDHRGYRIALNLLATWRRSWQTAIWALGLWFVLGTRCSTQTAPPHLTSPSDLFGKSRICHHVWPCLTSLLKIAHICAGLVFTDLAERT